MVMMNNLYKWLEYVGLEVLTLNNWSTRGSSSFSPTIDMCHWIAGPRGVKPPNRPSLTVIRDGHSRLPGPLANDYMGRAGEVILVAAGRANHAGYGYWKGVTGNTGAMGTEPEAADNSDWTQEQRKSYPLIKIAHLFAMWEKGLISWNQIASNRVVGHSEYALPKGRKQDINGYTMTSMRAQIAALIPGFKKRVNSKPIKVGAPAIFDRNTYKFTDGTTAPTPTTPGKDWFDMATPAELRDIVKEEIRIASWAYKGNTDQDAWAYLRQIAGDLRTLLNDIGKRVWSYHNHLTTRDIYGHVRETNRAAVEIQGELAGILTALEQVGQGGEVNLTEVRKAAQDGVSAAISTLEADVTLAVNAGEKGTE